MTSSSFPAPPPPPGVVVGVLSVQGDVREHIATIESLGGRAVPVRRASELAGVDGLIIPGGESTTMDKLTRTFGLPLVVEQRGERFTARSLSLS